MVKKRFHALILSTVVAVLVGCGDSSDSNPKNQTTIKDPAIAAAESAALDTLDLHLQGRNALDAELMSASNNYPNLRLLTDGIQVFQTPEEYKASLENIGFPVLLASEWDHSEWDEIEVVQSWADKVHLAVKWSRINGDGVRYLARPQLYIVTNKNDHWGIMIRSPLQDVDLLIDANDRRDADAEEAALDVLRQYLEARNNRDSESLAALNHYPHALLDGVELQIFETPEDYISYEENQVIHALDYAEWDHSVLDDFEIIQSGPTKVHLTYSCQQLNVVGDCTDIEEGLWIITKSENGWHILGRSLL